MKRLTHHPACTRLTHTTWRCVWHPPLPTGASSSKRLTQKPLFLCVCRASCYISLTTWRVPPAHSFESVRFYTTAPHSWCVNQVGVGAGHLCGTRPRAQATPSDEQETFPPLPQSRPVCPAETRSPTLGAVHRCRHCHQSRPHLKAVTSPSIVAIKTVRASFLGHFAAEERRTTSLPA